MKYLITALAILTVAFSNAQTFTSYYEEDGLLSNSVNCVSVGESGEAWFGTQFGISHFDGTNWTNYSTEDGLIDNNITAIYFSDGSLWAGTDFGFSVFDGTNWTNYTTEEGIEDNRIKDFYRDSNGLMWIANNDGVSTFNGTEFINYTSSDGLPFGGVSHIAQDNDGNMWLSNGIFGAILFDGSTFTTFNEDNDLLSNSTRAIAVSNSNKKWIGTASGISVLDADNVFEENHEIIFVLPPPDELNPVEDVAIDSQGHVWAGVYVDYLLTVGGVSLYDSGIWIDYDESDGLAGPNVRAIDLDENDGLWVATSTGVTYISEVPFSMEEQQSSSLAIYPNPASDKVFVQTNSSSHAVEIYATTGQLVKSFPPAKNSELLELDLSSISSGVYFVHYGESRSQLIIE